MLYIFFSEWGKKGKIILKFYSSETDLLLWITVQLFFCIFSPPGRSSNTGTVQVQIHVTDFTYHICSIDFNAWVSCPREKQIYVAFWAYSPNVYNLLGINFFNILKYSDWKKSPIHFETFFSFFLAISIFSVRLSELFKYLVVFVGWCLSFWKIFWELVSQFIHLALIIVG